MNIRIYNARILSMENNTEIQMGEVWVEGNKITHLGEPKDNFIKWDREIDAKGNLVMPGFKNAHTHSPMTFLRSFADDLPLLKWLKEQVLPMEAKLTEEHVYWCTRLAIMEYVSSGITACNDMYMFVPQIAKACVDSGFRMHFVSGIDDFSSSIAETEEHYLKYNNYNELISYGLGFHAEYTCSEKLLKQVASLSHKYNAPVFAHISESKEEVDECIKRHNMTPSKYLNSLDMFEYGGGGYHCVHMTDEDLDIFMAKKLSIITNPASNAKLASGIADITKIIQKGINLAIGTDGPASNNCLDMFREMFLVTALSKLRENDASAVPADNVLKMATLGGAKSMGLNNCDCLKVGKLADLILIDLMQPNMQPINNIVKNIVYSGSKLNVMLTMINGNILYENGEYFIGVDKADVFKRVNDIMN